MSQQPPAPDGPIGSDLVREDPSFADIVQEFVNGLSERLRTMEAAVGRTDFDALRVAAHQLKGSGGGYGYPALSERAAVLERHARSHAIENCEAAIDELKQLCSRVVVDTAG